MMFLKEMLHAHKRKFFSSTLGFLILMLSLISLSCKRDKKDVIGPGVITATKNFKYLNGFSADKQSVNFVTDSNWFHATFSEPVSWSIKLRSLNSKAYKEIFGTSQVIGKQNSTWSGGNSGIYFFQPGDQVIAELTVFGETNKRYDTLTIVGEKVNYGSDVILWWDMNLNGVAKNGIVYWFDFYDGDAIPAVIGVGERKEDFLNNPHTDNDPIQGMYRSMQGKDGLGPTDYYIGAGGHTPFLLGKGFDEPLENVYLNFYLRKRTNTSAMGISLTSTNTLGNTAVLTYNVGKLDFEGWKLISIRLSDMTSDPAYPNPFDPSKIVKFGMNLSVHTNKGADDTGFDMDFITITKGAAFNPNRY